MLWRIERVYKASATAVVAGLYSVSVIPDLISWPKYNEVMNEIHQSGSSLADIDRRIYQHLKKSILINILHKSVGKMI
jgi:hypothetical protein